MIDDLLREVAQRYELEISGSPQPITGGDECDVWRIATDYGDCIIRVSPAWRSASEIQWTHDLMTHCAQTIPEVVAPVAAWDGSTQFAHQGRAVALYVFAEGRHLDRENEPMRARAARLLSRIHAAAMLWTVPHPRPASNAENPFALTPPRDPAARRDPPALHDPELDRWHEVVTMPGRLTTGPIHGDYYRRNLLCKSDRIVGVIDWDDCHIAPLMAEIAWSAWEFCKLSTGDDLSPERVRAYLDCYFEGDSPCPRAEATHLIAFIRWRLRAEARAAFARAGRGESWDQDYLDQEIRAFQRLKSCELTL
jgi:Ser/Thr protein kinase RdoA (MazF antagonist)